MADNIIKVILSAVLLICGVQDIRKKKILLWVVLLGAVLSCVCFPFCKSLSVPDRMGGAVVGVVIIILSLLTSGKIGMGDALLLCLTGLGLGFWGNLELFAIALFLAALLSIVLMVMHLADRKKSIPFVPFMFVSYLFIIIAGG